MSKSLWTWPSSGAVHNSKTQRPIISRRCLVCHLLFFGNALKVLCILTARHEKNVLVSNIPIPSPYTHTGVIKKSTKKFMKGLIRITLLLLALVVGAIIWWWIPPTEQDPEQHIQSQPSSPLSSPETNRALVARDLTEELYNSCSDQCGGISHIFTCESCVRGRLGTWFCYTPARQELRARLQWEEPAIMLVLRVKLQDMGLDPDTACDPDGPFHWMVKTLEVINTAPDMYA